MCSIEMKFLDPRSDDLPLVNSPLIIFGICVSYLYVVLSLGPRFMKNREPFQIKTILVVYNAFQIIANIFVWFYVRFNFETGKLTSNIKIPILFLQIVHATYYQGTFNLRCNEPTPRGDTSDIARRQVFATYFYFLLKVLDLLDTVSLRIIIEKTKNILPKCRRFSCYLTVYILIKFLFLFLAAILHCS